MAVGSVKCRECSKPPINGHLTIRAVKPSTICIECVAKHQKRNQVPTVLTEFVGWYIGQFGKAETQLAQLRRELEDARKRLAKYEQGDDA